MARPGRPRGSTIVRTAVVAFALLGVLVLATGQFISRELEPIDGRLGVPQRLDFPLCGIRYHLAAGESRGAGITIDPRFGAPYVLHPTIGQIPLVDLVMRCPIYSMPGGSGTVRSTVVWLQTGPNDYVSYELDGGP